MSAYREAMCAVYSYRIEGNFKGEGEFGDSQAKLQLTK